jgi:hypothetical protein
MAKVLHSFLAQASQSINFAAIRKNGFGILFV